MPPIELALSSTKRLLADSNLKTSWRLRGKKCLRLILNKCLKLILNKCLSNLKQVFKINLKHLFEIVLKINLKHFLATKYVFAASSV